VTTQAGAQGLAAASVFLAVEDDAAAFARAVVVLPGGAEAPFTVDAFSRDCLLAGVDELGYLLRHADAIAAFEAATEDR
jgi:3-isopropylmalate dehydratase small subunit